MTTATLNRIVPAVHAEAEGADAVDGAVTAHIGNTRPGGKPYAKAYKEAQLHIMLGRITYALELGTGDNAVKSAMAVLDSKGANSTSKLKDGERRRTAEEEAACGAARTYWSRVSKRLELQNPETRGGDTSKTRNAKKGAATEAEITPDAIKKGIAGVVKKAARNREEAYAVLEGNVQSMEQFCKKNAAVISTDVAKAVTAFRKSLKSIIDDES